MSAYDSCMEPPEEVSFDEGGDIERKLRESLFIKVYPDKFGTWAWDLRCDKYADNSNGIDGDEGIDTESEAFGDAQSCRERYVAQKMKSLEENAGNNAP